MRALIDQVNATQREVAELREKYRQSEEEARSSASAHQSVTGRLLVACRSNASKAARLRHANGLATRALNGRAEAQRELTQVRESKQELERKLRNAQHTVRELKRLLRPEDLARTRAGEKRRATEAFSARFFPGCSLENIRDRSSSDSDSDSSASAGFKRQRTASQTVACEWVVSH